MNECEEVTPNPCHNGGTCSNLIGSFSCSCPDGWDLPHCELGASHSFAIRKEFVLDSTHAACPRGLTCQLCENEKNVESVFARVHVYARVCFECC